MRILFLTETIPAPLDSGGRIKTFHTLGILSREHEVVCHAFIRHEQQRARAALLKDRCAELVLHMHQRSASGTLQDLARSALSARAFTIVRHDNPTVRAALLDEVRRRSYDVIYCDHLSTVQFARGLGLPILYDAHNVEWQLVERHGATLPWPIRPAAWLEANRVKSEERRACGDAVLSLAVSDRDAGELRRLAPGADIRTAPIALDVQALPFRPIPAQRADVIFVGGLHWPPNATALEWFGSQVWPDVHRRSPEATLYCLGRASDVQRARLEAVPGVSVLGAIEDIEPWFQQARLMVVPLQSGSGMRVKILDALARGVPVVTTRVGGEGIDAVPDTHLLVADGPERFADAVLRLLADDRLAESLAHAGRHLALARYDLEAVRPVITKAVIDAERRQTAPR